MSQQVSIQQAMELALQHHSAGRLREAEQIYRQVLSADANHADSLHLLGMIALQVGRADQALELIGRAIGIAPSSPIYHGNIGSAQAALGRLDDAIASYRQAISLHADFPEAWNNLGNALRAKGQLVEAADAYRRAIALRDAFPEAHANLGQALQELGQFDEAIAQCRQAIALRATDHVAYNTLGNALKGQGRVPESIAAYEQSLKLQPNFVQALSNLGNALRDSGQTDQALAAYRKAIALAPDRAEVKNNLAAALLSEGQLDEATQLLRESLAARQDFPEAWNNLGNALRDSLQVEPAIDAYRRAIALRPDWSVPQYNLGWMRMLQGDFSNGLPLLESRLRDPQLHTIYRDLKQSMWDGADLNGRTLFLHAEQGFGDTIQFVRYVPLAAQPGAKIILACQPELKRLLSSMKEIEQVVTEGDDIPPYDVHCLLLSLPLVLHTTVETIPATVPYIHVDEDNSSRWRKRLAQFSGRLKVGIAWAGRPTHRHDKERSIPLKMLHPIINTKDIDFFSLQKGLKADEGLTDWTEELHDFADTAALIQNLDLIITVDTATAHLSGALGKPVWVMLPFAPDWRWMLNRNDSPWYPTMKMFRQPKMDDWQTVIEQIVQGITRYSPAP